MFDYDYEDCEPAAWEVLDDDECAEHYAKHECECGNCCSCLGISEKDFV